MIKAAYIHIPFCQDICSYCDFCKLYYHDSWVDEYLKVLQREIKDRYLGEELTSIYIGGGTPSVLSCKQLTKLLDITTLFKTVNPEFTFECNIESIDEEKAILLKNYGVNRLSIGIQTFNEKFLSLLNRHHTKEEALKKIKMLKKYFTNINIDLIYALKGQTLADLKEDLDTYLSLEVTHISTYSLIIDEHTMMYNDGVKPIDEDLDYQMYELICHELKDYDHYEISNFGYLPSRHNMTYWNNEEYYGFGLGASGYEGNVRYTNTRSLSHYLKDQYVYQKETLSFNETIENAFILGLRKLKGMSIADFDKRYHIDINKLDVIEKLLKEKKLIKQDDYIYINPKYLYTSNDILLEFMGVDYEKYV